MVVFTYMEAAFTKGRYKNAFYRYTISTIYEKEP